VSGVSLASGGEAAYPPALADRFAVGTAGEGSWCVACDREPRAVRGPAAADEGARPLSPAP
jgi:hypothetical protein